MLRNQELVAFERSHGIYLPDTIDFIMDGISGDLEVAMDAQPALVTVANSGIPNWLSTYIDPKVIEVLTTPNNATKIIGDEGRKGDWVTETAEFPIVETTGEVSSYGDYNTNGRAGANVNWVPRQSYLYQLFTEWGEREADRMGLAKIAWAQRLNISAARVLDKYQNNTYFYGVAGLANYGILNDPALSPALTPGTKTGGGTSWKNALPTEILKDVQSMFAELQLQTGSNLELDATMTLAMHSVSEVYIANTNDFGLTAAEMIKKVFPNLTIKQAPQYLSGTTYSCQLIVHEIDGQQTATCGFNEKMRAHRIIAKSSSWKQKKTQGTWGTIWFMPMAVAQMAGI